jgi:hypothetical protein
MTQLRENGSIASTITGNKLGDSNQITVIRRKVFYDELVFDNEEQFEHWKNLADNGEWDEFKDFNQKHFVDIWYDTRLDIDPDRYVALSGDQTIATDDWIFTGIFNEESVNQYYLNELEVT